MLKIPLDEYSTRHPRPEILVYADEEDGYPVILTIELEPNEMVGTVRTDDRTDGSLEWLRLVKAGAHYLADQAGHLTDPKVMQAHAEGLTAYIDVLHRLLASARNETEVRRRLLPHEARAVAAALRHQAEEVDHR